MPADGGGGQQLVTALTSLSNNRYKLQVRNMELELANKTKWMKDDPRADVTKK